MTYTVVKYSKAILRFTNCASTNSLDKKRELRNKDNCVYFMKCVAVENRKQLQLVALKTFQNSIKPPIMCDAKANFQSLDLSKKDSPYGRKFSDYHKLNCSESHGYKQFF